MLASDVDALFLAGDIFTKGEVGEPFKYDVDKQEINVLNIYDTVYSWIGDNSQIMQHFQTVQSLEELATYGDQTFGAETLNFTKSHKKYIVRAVFICSVKNRVGKKFAILLYEWKIWESTRDVSLALADFDSLKLTEKTGGGS